MNKNSSRFGLSVALATPFREDGTINVPALIDHAQKCLDGGCSSVTLFGTTGEGPSLSIAEKTHVFDAVREAGIDASSLIAGVASSAAGDAAAHAASVLDSGARGVLLTPAYYFKQPDDEGIYQWFASVLRAMGSSARDLILYNIPQLTGVSLSNSLVSRLRADFGPAIIGVKDSSCEWTFTKQLLEAHGDLIILIGDERDLAAAVREGGSGAINGMANMIPGALLDTLILGRDDDTIMGIIHLANEFPIIPVIKAMIAEDTGDLGWRRVRAPQSPLNASQLDSLLPRYRVLRAKL